MNIDAQLILNKHLNNVEVGESNRHIINAMKEYASYYHKKQLLLYDVVKSFVCDIDKGIRCEGSIADYKDGKCKVCGQQAN